MYLTNQPMYYTIDAAYLLSAWLCIYCSLELVSLVKFNMGRGCTFEWLGGMDEMVSLASYTFSYPSGHGMMLLSATRSGSPSYPCTYPLQPSLELSSTPLFTLWCTRTTPSAALALACRSTSGGRNTSLIYSWSVVTYVIPYVTYRVGGKLPFHQQVCKEVF